MPGLWQGTNRTHSNGSQAQKRAMLGGSQPRKQTENLAQSQTADAEVPQQCSNRAHKNQA
jgi:hypothetical protein